MAKEVTAIERAVIEKKLADVQAMIPQQMAVIEQAKANLYAMQGLAQGFEALLATPKKTDA